MAKFGLREPGVNAVNVLIELRLMGRVSSSFHRIREWAGRIRVAYVSVPCRFRVPVMKRCWLPDLFLVPAVVRPGQVACG